MSLGEIRDILAGPAATKRWAQLVDDRIALLQRQIDRMVAVRETLEHIRAFHRDSAPDGCVHYESLIRQRDGGVHLDPTDDSQRHDE